jgi:uncharacterized membrane-anchored protein
MQDEHVPSVGVRYWGILFAASLLGANLGDLLAYHLPIGVFGRMLILAAVLAAVFFAERHDRSRTDVCYWMAVVIIQAASIRLANFSTIDLGFGRPAVIGVLAVILVATFRILRSSPMLVISTHMISRPGAAAKPMADAAHWTTMVVASTLGTVTSDFITYGLGLGAMWACVILIVLLGVSFGVNRLPGLNLLLIYWLTSTIVRGLGNAYGDLLTKNAHLPLALPLSSELSGGLLFALLVLWPRPTLRS